MNRFDLTAPRIFINPGLAIEKGDTRGFMKVVVDAETRKILGGAILGMEPDA